METHSHGEIAGLVEENWWYVARRHVLEGLFVKFPPTRGTALDLGSGVGANFPVLALHANKIIGLDISQEALDHAQERGYHETLWLLASRFRSAMAASMSCYAPMCSSTSTTIPLSRK